MMAMYEPKFPKRIAKAKAEAERFLAAVKEYEDRDNVYSNRQSAAVKRSSMDLSRALTEVRKGDW